MIKATIQCAHEAMIDQADEVAELKQDTKCRHVFFGRSIDKMPHHIIPKLKIGWNFQPVSDYFIRFDILDANYR